MTDKPYARSDYSDTPHAGALVIAPWVEGGGAMKALAGILTRVHTVPVDLVVLFDGNRNYEPLLKHLRNVEFLEMPRNAIGAARAAFTLRQRLKRYQTCYSLLRGSHVVLGLLPSRDLPRRIAATFHQLPSSDRESRFSAVEEKLVRRALKRATLVTAPSERALGEVAQYGLAPSEVLTVENNLVIRWDEPLDPAPVPTDVIRLVAVGRITEQKGFDRLPHLLSQVSMRVDLRIVGEGPERDRVLAAEWPANVKVESTGHVRDIREQLDWSHFLILPSRAELNPLAVWEAWSRGRGVIASSLPVFEDLAAAGPMRLFSSPEDVKRLLAVEAAAEFVNESMNTAVAARENPHISKIAEFINDTPC